MPKKLTQEEYCQRVRDSIGDKYTVISKYKNKSSPVTFHCNIHNIDFTVSAECFMRGSKDVRGACPQCAKENQDKRYENSRAQVECAYCGKSFTKQQSKLNNSKSGLYFCCREHKDLAQSIGSGDKFESIRPDHYTPSDLNSATIYTYRRYALSQYENCCAICGFNEDVDLLEVHHIDENRENNCIDNLIILCPLCHKKLTSHKYVLVDRHTIIKV